MAKAMMAKAKARCQLFKALSHKKLPPTPVLRLRLLGLRLPKKGKTTKPAAKAPEIGKARAGDWSAPVVRTAEALDRLDGGVKAVVALLSSPHEAELMWSILSAKSSLGCLFDLNYKTVVRPLSKNLELLLSSFRYFCTSPMAFVLSKDTAFDVVTALPKPTSLEYSASSFRHGQDCFSGPKLRLAVPWYTWGEVKKNAGLNLRSWALHSEGLRSTDFRDTWGWEQRGQDDIQGLVRVNQAKADQL